MKIQINQEVTRVQPGDYTNGRKGTVVEINEETQRARVYWHTSPTGNSLGSESKRTWCKFSVLR